MTTVTDNPARKEIGVLILAAGKSSRMGYPKQTIPWGDKPLIRHIADTATSLSCGPVVIVTGAHSQGVADALEGSSATCHYCPQWAEGMAASLHSGLCHLMLICPDMAGMLLLLGDQPMVNASYLESLLLAYAANDVLFAASAYAGSTGPPVLFSPTLFQELLELRGDRGAKHILKKHSSNGIFLLFEPGSMDLDTPEDIPDANR